MSYVVHLVKESFELGLLFFFPLLLSFQTIIWAWFYIRNLLFALVEVSGALFLIVIWGNVILNLKFIGEMPN